jgi:hypothetical protein
LRRLALLVPVLTLLAGATVLGEASPSVSPRQVVILDGSVRPVTLRVPVGATVEFLNRGRRIHRIKAERNLWAPIVLRSGGRAGVRLLVPGRYPYKVDGRVDGELIAGTPIAGFPPKPGSTLTEIDYRYSVRIDAHLHERTTFSGSNNPGSNGTEDAELTWTTRVPLLALKVQLVGADATLGSRSPPRGTFTGRFEFSETRTSVGACAGGVNYAGLVAEVFLQGSRQSGRATVGLDAGLTPAASDRYDAIRAGATAAAGCPGFNDADWLDETVPVDRGVTIHHPPSFSIAAWDTRWSREGRGTPFPLDRMLSGVSFTVASGVRSFPPRSCGDGCAQSFTGSVKYVFTALPARR